MAEELAAPYDIEAFLSATEKQALQLLAAEDAATYEAGMAFMSLAMSAMSAAPDGETVLPGTIYWIWGALTDEIDGPGRGTPEQDAAAVKHMKQAAAEWLAVWRSPEGRQEYLDRWKSDFGATRGSDFV